MIAVVPFDIMEKTGIERVVRESYSYAPISTIESSILGTPAKSVVRVCPEESTAYEFLPLLIACEFLAKW